MNTNIMDTDFLERDEALTCLQEFQEKAEEGLLRPARVVEGFLFSIAVFPEFIEPAEWMDIVIPESDAELPLGKQELEVYMHAVMSLLMDMVLEIQDCNPASFREVFEGVTHETVFEERSNVSQWCFGFALGTTWLNEAWDKILQASRDPELSKNFQVAQTVLLYFISRKTAEKMLAELKLDDDGPDFEKQTAMFLDLAPDAQSALIMNYHALMDEEQAFPSHQESGKPKRNDPCPCGSGKKYKKCCMTKEDEGDVIPDD